MHQCSFFIEFCFVLFFSVFISKHLIIKSENKTDNSETIYIKMRGFMNKENAWKENILKYRVIQIRKI